MLRLSILLGIFLTICSSCGSSDHSSVASSEQDQGIDAVVGMDVSVQQTDASHGDSADMGILGIRPSRQPTPWRDTGDGQGNLSQPISEGHARAGKVELEEELIRGPEANCRLGDFRMDNEEIVICIQGESTFSQFSFFGGNIVDAHLVGRPGTDAFRELFIAADLGESRVDRIGVVRDGRDGGPAIVRTEGGAQGALIFQGVAPNLFVPPAAQVVTEYSLAPNSNVVQVSTWVHLQEDFAVDFKLVDLLYFGDQTHRFVPGSVDGEGPLLMDFVGATAQDVSYGWYPDYAPFSFFISVAFDIPGTPTMTENVVMQPDDMLLFERTLVIGDGDIESIRQSPQGREVFISAEPSTHVAVLDDQSRLVTTVMVEEDGNAAIRLEDGEYQLALWPLESLEQLQSCVVSEAQNTCAFQVPPVGILQLSVTDQNGAPIDVMVRFRGAEDRTDFVLGEKEFDLSPGSWTLTITRGSHYSSVVESIEVNAGQTTTLSVELTQEITPRGYASGEFHQHASPSLDSTVAVQTRIESNLAAGVDFMVPSDHDIIYPYHARILEMAVDDRLSVPLTGVEVSPLYAHMGAYGIPYNPYGGAGGAIRLPELGADGRWFVSEMPILIERARILGAQFIQINHPRASQGYFDHVGYEPTRPLSELDAEKFTDDFESVEVFNSPGKFCQNFQDWQGLLNQGLRVTAIGNSDTHSVRQAPGYPRNYLPTSAAQPHLITKSEVVDAVRSGNVIMGGAAFLTLGDGVDPGDDVRVMGSELVIPIKVETPSFTRINRIIAFGNGQIVLDQSVSAAMETLVDFEGNVTIPVDEDMHLTIIAFGEEPLTLIRPGAPVFSMTNPIYIDHQGDGFTPPGIRSVDALPPPFCRR